MRRLFGGCCCRGLTTSTSGGGRRVTLVNPSPPVRLDRFVSTFFRPYDGDEDEGEGQFEAGAEPRVVDEEAFHEEAATYASLSSRERIGRLIEEGLVTVNGVVQTKKSFEVKQEAVVEVHVPEVSFGTGTGDVDVGAVEMPEILFEDADVIVVNKPPNLVVHPSIGTQDGPSVL